MTGRQPLADVIQPTHIPGLSFVASSEGLEELGRRITDIESYPTVLSGLLADPSTPSFEFVVIDEADKFVTEYRPQLEDYVAKPSKAGVLILDVDTWPSNTRLYKAVAASGLNRECKAPTGPALVTWPIPWAKPRPRPNPATGAAGGVGRDLGRGGPAPAGPAGIARRCSARRGA